LVIRFGTGGEPTAGAVASFAGVTLTDIVVATQRI
jgi:hypothetical protein